MTNFLTTSQTSAATSAANTAAIASANRRKEAAYNALAAHYGPEAGDPEAQGQLQANALNAQLNPLKVKGAQQEVDLAAAVNPETITQAGQKTQAGALALDKAGRDDSRQQSLRLLGFLHDSVSNGSTPQEAWDSVPAEALGALGVAPEHVAPLREAFGNDPAGFIDHFYSGLQAGEEQKVVGAGTVIRKEDGSYAIVKTDQRGNSIMSPLDGAPVAAVQGDRRLDIQQQGADAATVRADKAGAGNGQPRGGVLSSVPAIDGEGKPGTILTYRDGTQQFTYPGGAPVAADKQVVAATKAAETRAKNATAVEGVLGRTAAVPAMTQDAVKLVDRMSPSPIIRKLSANIPGTAEYQFNELLGQIKPNLSLQDLTSVRQQGLSLGQVTVKEFEAAGNAYANMDLGQPQSTLRANLRRVESVFNRVNANLQADVDRLRAAPGAPAGTNPLEALKKAAPGATVTSTTRSPEKNKAVNGVANSDHLTGQAADFVPRQGQTIAQLADELRSAGVGQVVPEPGRNHVHVEWGPGAGSKAAPTSDAALLAKYGVK